MGGAFYLGFISSMEFQKVVNCLITEITHGTRAKMDAPVLSLEKITFHEENTMPTEVETRNSKPEIDSTTDLKEIARDVVQRARKAGATAAEAIVREGSEFSSVVRLGEVETL